MAEWRQAVELAMSGEDIGRLTGISHSRTEPASRVERAQMLLAYQEKPSFCAVGEKLGMHHQTVQRCVERALAYGALRHSMTDRGRSRRKPRPVGVAGVRQGQGARLCARIMDDTAFGPPCARARTGGGARMPRPPGARHSVQDPRPRGNQAIKPHKAIHRHDGAGFAARARRARDLRARAARASRLRCGFVYGLAAAAQCPLVERLRRSL